MPSLKPAMATGTIMDACEVIEKKADGDNGNDVKAQVTKIYEACSFKTLQGNALQSCDNAKDH